jgi:TDG/mug DNA glycosylase family protein
MDGSDGQTLKRSFPPVVNPGVRVLVLGSLPGERSLAAARYYAHPQNQFWRLIGAVIQKDLASMGYEQRLDVLLGAGVGLWDSVGSATRKGSLDAEIRGHEANPLAELAASLHQLRAIGFNGGTSAKIGIKALGEQTKLELVPLPSSSPAYTLPFERKREAWLRLREFL